MRIILFILFFPFISFGQKTTLEGKVVNAKTKEIIPFATVGMMKEKIGTNADENGIFTLVSQGINENDSLVISCLGYSTQKLPIDKNNKTGFVIELTEQVMMLKEVVVKNKTSWTTETLNDFSNCGSSFISSNGYQTQLAQHFEVKEENAILTRIKICRNAMALVDPEKTIFRIRIYGIDSIKKSPSTDLCDQIIEVKTRSKTVYVNLEKYKIHIPSKDFFVAVEWLKIPFNENRSKTIVNGKEVEYITYRPSIGWTDQVNTKMEAWMLDYNNVWRPMFKTMRNKTSVSIAATVTY